MAPHEFGYNGCLTSSGTFTVHTGSNAGVSIEQKMQIGDRVRAIRGGSRNGEEGTIESSCGTTNGQIVWTVQFAGYKEGYYEYNLELLTNKNKTMNIKEKFTLAFLKEPEKSFRKTGITNGDNFLTDDGQKVFLGWLLKEHGEKFKTDVVDELLKDLEDDK